MNRILIVDDNSQNLYLLRTQLDGLGYVIDEARHGAEALVKAHQSPPDLIIADLLMPVMDGYTLLRRWKADARLRDIPFIVHTATYTDPKDAQLALDLGADAFILKPAETAELTSRVHTVLTAGRGSRPPHPRHPAAEEEVLLKEYNEVLVNKLEEKSLQLEEANRVLAADVAGRKAAEIRIQQLNRVYAVLSDINQTIVREQDPQAVLASACRIAVDTGKFRLAWIGRADAARQRIAILAHAGASDDTLQVL